METQLFNLRKLEEQFKTHSFSTGVEYILYQYDLKPDGCATTWKKITAFTRHFKKKVWGFFVVGGGGLDYVSSIFI